MVGVDHQEVDDRVDLDGDVVVGDDLLRRHLEGDGSQVNLDQAVDAEGNDDPKPWALQRHQAAKPKEHAPFVLIDDADRGAKADQDNKNDDAENDQRENAHRSLLENALLLMLRVAIYA